MDRGGVTERIHAGGTGRPTHDNPGAVRPGAVQIDAPPDAAADFPTQISISDQVDFRALETKWRDLEARSNPSFFQSWTWTGCLAEERFARPVLVEATAGGRTVALALFNRRGRTLHLGESGDSSHDEIFIEYNGVLVQAGLEMRLTTDCMRAARAWSGRGPVADRATDRGWFPWKRRLVLNGVDPINSLSAGKTGSVRCNRSLPSPFVDLLAGGQSFLENRSANTRHQLRRSNRSYAANGEVTIDRAATLGLAYEFFDELAALHQQSWIAREKPGAFAKPFFVRFHRCLISRGLERDEIDLFRIAAGPQLIGLLYNFRYRGHSLSYQSGFDYRAAGRHQKPGFTCHHAAIQFAAGWGATRYGFLAGNDRYKWSFSDGADTLYWLEVASPFSPRIWAGRVWPFLVGGGRLGFWRRNAGETDRKHAGS